MQPTTSNPRGKRAQTPAAVVLLSLSLLLSAQAQTGPASAAAQKQTAGAAGPEVSIDLLARDKKGNLVSDLTPADLEITAGGAAVPVKSLVLGGAAAAGQPLLVTLVFDRMDPGNAKVARDTAFDVFKAAPASGVTFAVLKVDGRLHLLLDYTTDREALKTAVNAATVAEPSVFVQDSEAAEKPLAPGSVIQPGSTAQMLLNIILESQASLKVPHTTAPMAALLAAARKQKDAHGRKTVVFFSQGLNYDLAAPEMIGEIVQAANASGVSIYSVDAHIVDSQTNSALLAGNAMSGVSAGAQSGMAGSSPRVPSDTSAGAGAGSVRDQQMGRIESSVADLSGLPPLGVICRSTDGAWMLNNERAKTVRRIVADLNGYYVASFPQPSPENARSLRIKALRAGVVIEARSSFVGSIRAMAAPPSALEARLVAALAAPALPSDLMYRASLLRLRDTVDGTLIAVAIEAPAGQGGSGPISVLAQVKDKSGQVVQKFSEDLARPAAPQDVISFNRHFSAAPGQYTLETAVVAGEGGKAAAQRQTVEVPAAPAAGPELGEIVLARRIEPSQGDPDPLDPLRCADGTVIPNLSGRVSRAAQSSITLFFDIHPDAHTSGTPELSGEVRMNGKLIATVPMPLAPIANRTSIPYLANLPTSALRPGAYDLKMIFTQGAQKAERSVVFKVEE